MLESVEPEWTLEDLIKKGLWKKEHCDLEHKDSVHKPIGLHLECLLVSY